MTTRSKLLLHYAVEGYAQPIRVTLTRVGETAWSATVLVTDTERGSALHLTPELASYELAVAAAEAFIRERCQGTPVRRT